MLNKQQYIEVVNNILTMRLADFDKLTVSERRAFLRALAVDLTMFGQALLPPIGSSGIYVPKFGDRVKIVNILPSCGYASRVGTTLKWEDHEKDLDKVGVVTNTKFTSASYNEGHTLIVKLGDGNDGPSKAFMPEEVEPYDETQVHTRRFDLDT